MPDDELTIEKTEGAPSEQPMADVKREHVALHELAREFHLFTLGPVYIGARIDQDMLQVFAKQEGLQFKSVLVQQVMPMFHNLNEWDFMVQGIEKRRNQDGTPDNSLALKFSTFMQGWEFVRKETGFYSKVFTRPVQVVPRGEQRGANVEVFMLSSNKGTHVIQMLEDGTYEISTDREKVAPHVARDAKAVLDVLMKEKA